MHGDKAKELAVEQSKLPVRNATEPSGLLQHGVEHWGEIAWRGVDDLQNLGRRRLLLQGFALFAEESCIFYRDHRLGGKVLQEGDLLVGE